MIRVILEHIVHFIFVLPIILLFMKDRKLGNLKVLLAFSIFFIVNSTLLYLPIEYNELKLVNGNWNWTGKVYAILGAFIFLMVYRKFELKDYFLTLKQDKKNLKKGIIILSSILLIQVILDAIYGGSREWNNESILYQLTMPGINEEIAYRGIMLGLLVKILKPNNILHPAIIVTSILFGMGHGLFLNSNFELVFNAGPFIGTMVLGMIWAWVTIKTGSILLALLSHNLSNTAGMLIGMIK